ncbi:MAG: 50S ribosomal protein L17 [bacterium]
MRHRRVAKKFGRSTSHREQMLGSLVANLILRDRIETTLSKAKVARQDAEKIVTLARKGLASKEANVNYRRLAAARLRSPAAVARLFETVVPTLAGRPGGYTRIAKLGRRTSDGSTMAILEWVTVVTPAAAPSAGADAAAAAADPAAAVNVKKAAGKAKAEKSA